MLRGKLVAFLLCVVVLLNNRQSYSAPGPLLELSQLTRDSSVIVVGKIVSVRDAGSIMLSWQGRSIPAQTRVAELHADRTIKGKLPATMVTFQFVASGLRNFGFRGITIGQFGMFFLKTDSSGGYTVTSPYNPFVVSTPDAPATQGGEFERVVSEVVNVLASTKSSNDDRVSAIFALEGVNMASATEALHRATQNSDAKVRFQSLAVLLSQNDIAQLPLAETILLRGGVDAEDYLIGNVARAVRRIKDPKAIPALTRLLDSRYPEARRSAAEAIANTGGHAAIKPLAKALYHGDHDVRYQAVRGLAMITGQHSWYPSIEWFEEDERRFLTYWRNWAKAN